jgi:hypothetical protein
MIVQNIEKFKTTYLPLEDSKIFTAIVKHLKSLYIDEDLFICRYVGDPGTFPNFDLIDIYHPKNAKLQFSLRWPVHKQDPYIEAIGFPIHSKPIEIFDLRTFKSEFKEWMKQAGEYIRLQDEISPDYYEEDLKHFDSLFSKSEKKEDDKIFELRDQEKVERLLSSITAVVDTIPDITDEQKESILKYIETTSRLLGTTQRGAIRERILKIFSKIKKISTQAFTYTGKKLLEAASKKAGEYIVDDVVSIIRDTI